MKGKFLTENIVLTVQCIGTNCDYEHPLSISKLWSEGLDDECPECDSKLTINEEFIVKN